MTLEAIKQAVDTGKAVFWSSILYRVVKDSLGQYLIKCFDYYIGLETQDGRMNGKPEEFYIL